MAVLEAASGLSPEISLPTCHTAYEPFTPSNSEQRWPPTSYRGCWHVVSRGFFYWYRHSSCEAFVPVERGLHTEMLHPPRGVAASGFRPLCKIPHCCLPLESGPCLSSSVAGHPLRPANDQSLGRPLPYQLANRARAPPSTPYGFESSNRSPRNVMRNSLRFPEDIPHRRADCPRVTHPCAVRHLYCYRRALDLHVLSTPPAFVLSQDQTLV